jgi:hypothetical protein
MSLLTVRQSMRLAAAVLTWRAGRLQVPEEEEQLLPLPACFPPPYHPDDAAYECSRGWMRFLDAGALGEAGRAGATAECLAAVFGATAAQVRQLRAYWERKR